MIAARTALRTPVTPRIVQAQAHDVRRWRNLDGRSQGRIRQGEEASCSW